MYTPTMPLREMVKIVPDYTNLSKANAARHEEMKNKYLGLERYNNQGCLMRIVRYINRENCVAEFYEPDRVRKCINLSNFLRGTICNEHYPTIYGVGVVGTKYPIYVNNEPPKSYILWKSMIGRCRSSYRKAAYIDVTCDPRFFHYEYFREWLCAQPNWDIIQNVDFSLDKDILIKGNRMYGPETCCLVPSYVNSMMIKGQNKRGPYPIGVYRTKNNRYSAIFSYMRCGKPVRIHLGTYDTPEEAFLVYKEHKEAYIKSVAVVEYNKGMITYECFRALMEYQVEITD